MLTTLNDRTKPFRFKGDTRLLRVGLNLITVPGSARVLDSQGITDVVSGVLIEPISRKFPALGLLRWLDVNGRIQGEELRLEFEQTDFYPTVSSISGFELWFRKGVTLNASIENGGGSVNVTDYSGALATLQSSLDAIGVTVNSLALASIDGGTDNTSVLTAIAGLQQSINALPTPATPVDYLPALVILSNGLDALQQQQVTVNAGIATLLTRQPTPTPTPAPTSPVFLPYTPTALSNTQFYRDVDGLSALNDGTPDTTKSVELQRGAYGMICFLYPVILKLTFQGAVRLTRMRMLTGQFNGDNYNKPTGFSIFKGETADQNLYTYAAGFTQADGQAFKEFDLTSIQVTDSAYRIEFYAQQGISIYELQFFGVPV